MRGAACNNNSVRNFSVKTPFSGGQQIVTIDDGMKFDLLSLQTVVRF